MQRMLLARECGEDGSGLEDALLDRWTNLRVDSSREINPIFAEEVTFVDIETQHGALLLCGGTAASSRGGQNSACVGIFRILGAKKNAMTEPIVFAAGDNAPSDPFTCGKWFPGDPGLFIAGGNTAEISVWDTSCFEMALQIPLVVEGEDPAEVTALSMSSAPGARCELVATARTASADVTLFDLGSGAFTHRLEGHVGHVTDVTWSPTNPYLLASCGTDGGVRLFDVRRAGNMACVVAFDEVKKLPVQTWELPPTSFEAKNHATKRRKISRKHATAGNFGPALSQSFSGLGLGSAWDNAAAPQARRRKRRSEASRRLSLSKQPQSRVRFSPNGTTLLSMGRDGILQVWDVHTGSSITAHPLDGETRNPLFEVARDDYHVLIKSNGDLRICDFSSGEQLSRNRGHMREMREMTVHPRYEELYTASANQIICWSGANSAEKVEA